MPEVLARVKRAVGGSVSSARHRWGWLDHLVHAAGRYQEDGGNRLAAGLTYYGFLAILPLLLLSTSVLGFIASDPERQAELFRQLADNLPGIGDVLADNLSEATGHRRTTGVVGVLGLVVAGLGGIDALREAIRLMWHQDPSAGGIVGRKLNDVVVLLGLGGALLVSFAVSALGAGLATYLLDLAGVGGTSAVVALRLVSFALALVTDTLLFLYVFVRLPRLSKPFRRVLRGAVFAAVGFGTLKLVLSFYVGRTVANGVALYGTLGVVLGVLVGLNVISRFILFAAAWTVTCEGDDDVAPSGTSSPSAARAAGVAS